MAKKKPKLSGQVPVITGTNPQPTTVNGVVQVQVYGGPQVTLFSTSPTITLTAFLRAPVSILLPQPKIDTVDRPGLPGLTRWMGRDPYQMTVPIKFDRRAHGRSVHTELATLSSLALRHGTDLEPPAVQLAGPVPDAPGASGLWRVAELTEVNAETFTDYNGDGRCTRIAIDVTLEERTVDHEFMATLTATKGVKNRRETIHKGETLYHFAKRILHDRSKASEIARANGLRVSFKAQGDFQLRIP